MIDISEKRIPARVKTHMLPKAVEGEDGMVTVDVTWGKIQPLHIVVGVRTVGEQEVHRFQEEGLPIVDARTPDFYRKSTIEGAKNIPHTHIKDRKEELDDSQPTIFFCNGPQCTQSPAAIRKLIEVGFPRDKIWYYRGGMHDWITLGLPVVEKPTDE